MAVDTEEAYVRALKALSRTAAATAVFVGFLTLAGWAWDITALKSVAPGLVAMNPATAVAFLLTGTSLWLLQSENSATRARLWGQGCVLIVVVIGLLRIGGYLFGWDSGIDRLLFQGTLGTNRMAPNTAVHFVLVGLALALLDGRTWRGLWVAQLSASVAALAALFALVGYAFGANSLYGVSSYIPMALNTAAVFQTVSLGILCARPECGVMALIASNGPGGMMGRRLLPIAVVVPIALGWLRLHGQRAGLYGTEFGVSLMVALTVVILLAALWPTAWALNRADAARRRTEEELRKAHEELERRVDERTTELAEANAALQSEIVERDRAEKQVQRLAADLEYQVLQLAEANRELQQRNLENETFVYSVSHDLRSPLVNLQGFSKELGLVSRDIRDILAEHDLPAAVKARGLALVDDEMGESIRFIQAGVMRLSHIIDALLRLSRAGRVEYRPQRLDMQDIVQRIIESASGTIADRGATVTLQELPPAWGDATAIEQVFGNLVGNALKYLDPTRPGEITIGLADPAETADSDLPEALQTYFVRDSGLGIAEAYQAKIFQAFQRVHADVAPGEGMGLAIVRRIVARHGGRIWVRSSVGEGSTFFVALPAKPTRPASSRQQTSITEVEERSRGNGDRTADYSAGRR